MPGSQSLLCSRWAGLHFCHGPTLQLCQSTAPQGSYCWSGRVQPLLNPMGASRLVLHTVCACMDGLLPAATLRAEPPGQMPRASSVVAELAFVLALIPLCGYARAQRLKGVAFASGLASTERTAWSAWLHAVTWLCRPAVLLSSWTIGAKPENLLVAFQADFVRKVPMLCVARVVPLCQDSSHFRLLAICKGWLLDLLPAGFVCISALWAASFVFADPLIGCLTPLVATGITEPSNRLIAVCHHTVRCTIIYFIVPLSCHQGSIGSQAVVLAHLAPTALGATTAIAPAGNNRLPAVQVAIWALSTHPADLLVAVRLEVNVA